MATQITTAANGCFSSPLDLGLACYVTRHS
jgi:hypothetical protein